MYFQEILYIVGCIFSLEVLQRCCGGEYVHHGLCLGCRSCVTCGARLYGKAFLVKNISVHYGVCFHLGGKPVRPTAILGAGNTSFLCRVFALWRDHVCVGVNLCIRMKFCVCGKNLSVIGYICL